MRLIAILITFFCISLQAAEIAENDTTPKNSDANLTKVYIPTHYKDYKWDVGLIGSMIFNGTQIDYKRYDIGAGLHIAYHLNDSVSFHGEYINYFKTIAGNQYDSEGKKIVEAIKTNLTAVSVAYDFSAERTYSLFAKAGLGYETKSNYNLDANVPVSLLGFGFRYMFTERISGYVEGRWKMKLSNISEPDNALVGSIGVDYHFGLDDEKAKLIEEADKHNAWVDERLEAMAAAKKEQASAKE